MKTLCLNMIVKNESKIITRCLDSVKDYIDYYVICDTGSTDDTQKIIKDYFDKLNIKGEIKQHKWVNFGHNRTIALEQAKNKSDYILLIDADMTLVVEDKEFKDKLEVDMYSVKQISGTIVYSNVRIVKGDNDYEYVGVTHEYISCKKENHVSEKLETINMPDYTDGTNRTNKYKRDIEYLLDGLSDKKLSDGLKQRYNFYLAQSYRDLGKKNQAIKYYKKRVELGGWPEETFYSLYQIGLLQLIDSNVEEGVKYLLKAYNERPTRSEPLYQLAKYYRITEQYNLSKLFLAKGINIKMPTSDLIFLDSSIYDYMFKHELTLISRYTGDIDIGRNVSEGLIHLPNIQSGVKQDVINNMIHFVKPLVDYCPSFNKKQITINKTNENNNILNPSITYHNSYYNINVREVNYKFDISANKYHYDNHIQTVNRFAIVNNIDDTNFNTDLITTTSDIKTYDNKIKGYEDVRLIYYKDQLYGVCSYLESNPTGNVEMCLLKINNNNVEKVVRLKCEGVTNDNRTEKNWAPIVHDDKLLFLYSNQPTMFLECDVETGICTVYKHGTNSLDFSSYRGSSQIIKVKDKYLYVIHQVGFVNNRRYYYHRFVHMDTDLKILRVSPSFIFNDKPTIEFCSGICYDGKNIMLTYGFEDREAYIATIDAREVDFYL